ncbi:MAG: hypothetical protein IKS00_03780 [Bacteroidales bacterium]|nr:hypothetical protein [Bacteroidales bacterium]
MKLSDEGISQRAFGFLNIALVIILSLRAVGLVLRMILQLSECRSWGITECLVNYEGGFVRRGLLGQLLFEFTKFTGITPLVPITFLFLVSFGLTIYYFIKRFKSHHLSLVLLATYSFLGQGTAQNLFRKDYVIILLFILILFLYRKINRGWIKLFVMHTLVVLILFLHEGFFFSFVPILILIVLTDKSLIQNIMVRLLSFVPTLAVMALLCLYKGDTETAEAVHASWNALCDNMLGSEPRATIKSIGWTTEYALKFHWADNFGIDGGWGHIVFITLKSLFSIACAYYVASRFIKVFKTDDSKTKTADYILFTMLLGFELVSLSPMYFGLSCDYTRLFFYQTATAFIVYFELPKQHLKNLFPRAAILKAHTIISKTDNHFRPNKLLLYLIIVVTAADTII